MATVSRKNPPVPAKGRPDNVPVNQLLLDVENPRLSAGNGHLTQDELVRVLWTEWQLMRWLFR
jgi:hypothetical protein